ncbi:MAG: MFS transporter, partial [Lachnospiraceae bacterium]|nr:MFS transporter [Lachnospiraceae bacterium]
LSIPAGALADRYDRRALMMIGDGCSALGILFILVAMVRGEASLAEICIGVFISAVFSALLEPAFRATITDLLTKEEYSKASGLVSLAGNARYLLSPMIAGFLLTISDVKLLLIIDICTFFLTVAGAAVVKRGIATNVSEKPEPFLKSIGEGWRILIGEKGVFALVMVLALITMFMGMFQILAEPMVLAFSDAKTLGITETICACGMLVSGLYLGIRGIKKHYVRLLVLGLLAASAGMIGFGVFGIEEKILQIGSFGFLFFAALPVANNCLDYLVRTNIPGQAQGRVWGLIGFLSQVGYVVSYGLSGVLADIIGKGVGIGVGHGAAWVIMAAGVMMGAMALLMLPMKSIRGLEG